MAFPTSASRLIVVLALIQGCSPETASRIDDATHPIQPNVPAAPMPPAAPALPRLTPCPSGWRELAGPFLGDAVTCEPWPDGGMQDCGADSAHFPGTPGCSQIGTACPPGEWPEGLPAGVPVLYVRGGAAVGGDGSQAAPFGTVTAAVQAASAGTIVALGKSTFDEAVQLPAGITLWGACVAQSRLVPSTASSNPTVYVKGAGVVLANLGIGGPRPGLWLEVAGAAVELRDLIISGAQIGGIEAIGAVQITGARVMIRGTLPRAGVNDRGRGIDALGGAQVDLRWVAVELNREVAVQASGAGTRIKLSDAVVRDTQNQASTSGFGEGLLAILSGQIEGDRLALERNRFVAIHTESGGRVVLHDAVIRDTQASNPQAEIGIGATVTRGGFLGLQRVFVHHNRGGGLAVGGQDSGMELTDVIVRETLLQSADAGEGTGILAGTTATLTGTRVAVERNREAGLAVKGAAAVIEDLTARGTRSTTAFSRGGQGFQLVTSGQLTVTRALVDDNQCDGIALAGDGGVVLTDITVRNTRACLADGFGGKGLALQEGVIATATRIRVENNRSFGIVADGANTRLTLTDAAALDTAGDEGIGGNGGRFGVGVHAQMGAQLTLSRARVERSREVGILAIAAGKISGSDVVVRETLESDCPPAVCEARAGIGAAAIEGGSLVLTHFSITDNAMLGLELSDGGTADLQAGEISDNPIGANVQTQNFDLIRLQHEVIFRGNAQTLSTQFLPLPQLNRPVQ